MPSDKLFKVRKVQRVAFDSPKYEYEVYIDRELLQSMLTEALSGLRVKPDCRDVSSSAAPDSTGGGRECEVRKFACTDHTIGASNALELFQIMVRLGCADRREHESVGHLWAIPVGGDSVWISNMRWSRLV